ncbi:MAG: hypothetical protein K6F35_06400 [Lachnospiraceae bacterium]|nr:hypothetical protein [Lachnospiraceae bacterium]
MKENLERRQEGGFRLLLARILFFAGFLGGILYLLLHRGNEGAVELGIGILFLGMALGLFLTGFDLKKLALFLGGLFLGFAGMVNSGYVSAPFLGGRNPVLLFVLIFPIVGLLGSVLLISEAASLSGRCTERTEGVVVRSIRHRGTDNILRTQTNGRRGYLNYNICYEYDFRGRHYQGAQKALWPEKPGKHAMLRIDPKDPETFLSVPYLRYQRAAILLTLLMCLLGSAASLLLFR